MLKPSEQVPQQPERPVGELVHQLIEEGKTYARAELGVIKAIATAKGKALALPMGLLLTALLVIQAGITALALACFAALQWAVGSIIAGLITFTLFAAIAGGLAWYAVQRLRRDL